VSVEGPDERAALAVLGTRAGELLEHFAVYGRFTQRPIAGLPEALRDRLEIAPRQWSLEQVLAHAPDLLVIMMNPGASRPIDSLWSDATAQGFVATLPDRTQYQIMRLLLMARQQGLAWGHARVLNLSDLRTPQSAVLFRKLNDYSRDDSHSIFSHGRRNECAGHFSRLATPVLCAWGLSAQLGVLADAALVAAQGHVLLGVTADGRAYRHPLPQRFDLQRQWLALIGAQIQALAGTSRNP
jgi:hypothetical protein